MLTFRSLFGIACRIAASGFLIVATASLTHAQQLPAAEPLLLFPGSSSSAPRTFAIDANVASALESSGEFASRSEAFQPPPRRNGRPNFSARTSNLDGSAKYEFLAGLGASFPLGGTHVYETPGWAFQVGGGRNFNRNFGVILQFDYDHFGLQAATLNNQTYVYNTLLGCTPAEVAAGNCVSNLDGNNHVWSFTLNPTFTLATKGTWDGYAVVGGGFYHKVTNFTQPQAQEECSIYGCGYFTVNSNIDHYTSNAGGVNGGFGLTCKISQFANARVYLEARYVLVLNQPRNGITAANAATAPANATDLYPANSHRTTYIPIKLGLRF